MKKKVLASLLCTVMAVTMMVGLVQPAQAAELDFSMDVCEFDVSQFVIVPDSTIVVETTTPSTTDTTVVVPPATTDTVVVPPATTDNTGSATGTPAGGTSAGTNGSGTITNNYYYYVMAQKETSGATGTTGTTDAGTTNVTVTDTDNTSNTVKKLSRPVIRTYASSKGFIVGYKAVKGATGYQIRYIQGGSEYKINTGVTTKKVITPKKGKVTVYVRAFAKVNGKTVYSKWSQAGKTTVK